MVGRGVAPTAPARAAFLAGGPCGGAEMHEERGVAGRSIRDGRAEPSPVSAFYGRRAGSFYLR